MIALVVVDELMKGGRRGEGGRVVLRHLFSLVLLVLLQVLLLL